MCLVCEAYSEVDRRFHAISGETREVSIKYGGDEESLAQTLAFLFYGQDMTQHEREQVWDRAQHAARIFAVALYVGDGDLLDMQGSAYLIGFAHGQKFREMKESR